MIETIAGIKGEAGMEDKEAGVDSSVVVMEDSEAGIEDRETGVDEAEDSGKKGVLVEHTFDGIH